MFKEHHLHVHWTALEVHRTGGAAKVPDTTDVEADKTSGVHIYIHCILNWAKYDSTPAV